MAKSVIVNPYLDEWNKLGLVKRFGWWDVASYSDHLSVFTRRDELVKKYAWAIPNEEAIEALVKHSPLIEIGAGKGYWASLIKEVGGDILAFDNCLTDNHYTDGEYFFDIQEGDSSDLENHQDRTLFLCWPPYATPMAFECLKRYKGSTLIFVGEGDGGCTGDKAFWDLIEEDWTIRETVAIPNWPGIRDNMYIFVRKSNEEDS